MAGEEEGEDRTQNSSTAQFFKVNQNWHNLTPTQKHTLWLKKKRKNILESVGLKIKNKSFRLCLKSQSMIKDE